MRPQIERVFRFVLGLSFLPEKIRAWMFSTGTRAIEVLNAGMLLAWATVMMLDFLSGLCDREQVSVRPFFRLTFLSGLCDR